MTLKNFFPPCAALAAAALALSPAPAAAQSSGWEDSTTVPARMPGSARAPATARTAPAAARPAPSGDIPSASLGTVPADLYSQHLDAPVDPSYWLTFAYFTESGIDDSEGKIGTCELDGLWDIAFFRDILYGDIDLKVRMHDVFFTKDGGISATPDLLVGLAADVGWTWRFVDGGSIEARVAPGIYSAADAFGGGMFGIPFRGVYYRTLSPETSFMAGAEIRPGWEMVFMPLLGIAWQPNDILRVDLALPRTRAYLYLWRLTVFGGFEWRSMTFNMKGGSDPDDITLEDILLSAGARFRITDEFHLGAEIGTAFLRDVNFEVDGKDAEFDLDSGTFVRFFIGGPF